MLYTGSCYAGYLSFGKDSPSFIAMRPPLENSYDIQMTVIQLGLIFGLTISICVRVNALVATIRSILIQPFFDCKSSSASPSLFSRFAALTNSMPIWRFSVASVLLPFCCSLLINKNVISVISLISSVLCAYNIIIAPGRLTRSNESPISQHSAAQTEGNSLDQGLHVWPGRASRMRLPHQLLQVRDRPRCNWLKAFKLFPSVNIQPIFNRFKELFPKCTKQ